ncbi:MAG: metallophosphoesterase family protein [Acidimicrobiales bacterium]
MRLRYGLISDTHIPEALPELWPQVFRAFDGVDGILHGGDIYELEVIDKLGSIAPVWAARGNGDDGSGGRAVQPDDVRLKEAWLIEAGGLRIGLTHVMPVPESPPHWTVERAIERYFEARPDVVVYGDTHVEHITEIDGVLCVNPGSPTFPHNLNLQLGTIGYLDIVDGAASASIWRLTDHGIEEFDWDTWGRPW